MDTKHIHFIGIGGIGMSGLARHYLHEGWQVSGSDREPSTITKALEAEGVEFYSEQRADNITHDGGADKNIPLEGLVVAIANHCKQVVLIPGTGTDRLATSLPDAIQTPDLSAALEEARLAAEPADIILFSPAFASFGQYQNEYERNDEFINLVTAL